MKARQLRKLAKGVGPAKACELEAAFELGKRVARQTAMNEPLASPDRIYAFMGPQLQSLARESLRIILLDTRHRLIHDEEISRFLAEEELDLSFTTDPEEAHRDADYVLIATPTNYDPVTNYFDTTAVEVVIRLVLSHLTRPGKTPADVQ